MHVHLAGDSHRHGSPSSKLLLATILATVSLVIAEFAGGYLGHSVALLSDAVHNLSDLPSIVIAWLAFKWSARPADAQRTFGYGRAGILAAFTNAILLLVMAGGLFWEGLSRFLHPVAV